MVGSPKGTEVPYGEVMIFQEIILRLHQYWKDYGCLIGQPADTEVGAGTSSPLTFLRVLGPEPWKVAYVQPSNRPTDGRYGENPLRLRQHYQYQVIIKPSPEDIQEVYLNSLRFLKINLRQHDVRFVEDDWESPSLGASGLGWEVWLDGMEVTQFTYFQQVGGIELEVIPVELAYGLERLAMFIQKKSSVFELEWTEEATYGDMHWREEREFSRYNFEEANVEFCFHLFQMYEEEAKRALDSSLLSPAYNLVLKCSHIFNILDARRAISPEERASYIARIRALAKRCAELYLKKGKGRKNG